MLSLTTPSCARPSATTPAVCCQRTARRSGTRRCISAMSGTTAASGRKWISCFGTRQSRYRQKPPGACRAAGTISTAGGNENRPAHSILMGGNGMRQPPPLGSRTWKPEEEDYLMEKWGQISVPAIAKKLNRTTNAVKVRAQRLGLGAVLMARRVCHSKSTPAGGERRKQLLRLQDEKLGRKSRLARPHEKGQPLQLSCGLH